MLGVCVCVCVCVPSAGRISGSTPQTRHTRLRHHRRHRNRALLEVVQLEHESGITEARVQARLLQAAATVKIDAAVSGKVADDNRFALVRMVGPLR